MNKVGVGNCDKIVATCLNIGQIVKLAFNKRHLNKVKGVFLLTSFREERAIKKKLNILRTAANLFNRNGYYETTIEDIANELRVTKGSIYYYVDSKEDLLLQCHTLISSECIVQLKEIIEKNDHPVDKMEKAIESLILYIIEENAVFSVINRFNMPSGQMRDKIIEQRDEYEALFQSIIEEGVAKGYFYTENAKLSRLLILGSINFMSHWFKAKDEQSNQEIIKFFSKNLVKILTE